MSGNGDIQNPNTWQTQGSALTVGTLAAPPGKGDVPNPFAFQSESVTLSPGGALSSLAVNPIAFVYLSEVGINAYLNAGAALVTGRGNRNDAIFQTARAAGVKVLAYLDAMEAPVTNSSSLDTDFYGPSSTAPHWPYKDALNNYRVNFAGDYMTDITVGSAWSDHVVAYAQALMLSGTVDGIMFDVFGSRLWSILAAWSTWTSAEQRAWTAGVVDILQRIDVLRRALNPSFIVVNNNVWAHDALGLQGLAAVNGFVMEHHTPYDAFGNLTATALLANDATAPGLPRFVVAIATTDALAKSWATVPGVTHVSSQLHYTTDLPTPPVNAVPPTFIPNLTAPPQRQGDVPNPWAWATGSVTLDPGNLDLPHGNGDIMDPYAWEDSVFLLTSQIYPVDVLEHFLAPGRILDQPQYDHAENSASFGAFLGGSLTSALVTYSNWPAENISNAGVFLGGTLNLALITYSNWPAENISDTGAFLGGTLTLGLVTYTNWPAENMQASGAFLGGTLT